MDPDSATKGSGCSRTPTSAFVELRNPSFSAKPLMRAKRVARSTRAETVLYVAPPSERSLSLSSRRAGPRV
jgi:hypothetical protein